MLSTLATLKSRLLIAANATATTWDHPLQQIGTAVAKAIDRHCNRRLAWNPAHLYTIQADLRSLSLPGYPIHEITAVTLQTNNAPSATITRYQLFKDSGILEFARLLGTYDQALTVEYSGGYKTGNETTAPPSTVPPVPDDILEAWLLQCAEIAHQSRIFEARAQTKLTDAPSPSSFAQIALLPSVRQLLTPHLRYA